jgi:trimeric autotransporter adhesin
MSGQLPLFPAYSGGVKKTLSPMIKTLPQERSSSQTMNNLVKSICALLVLFLVSANLVFSQSPYQSHLVADIHNETSEGPQNISGLTQVNNGVYFVKNNVLYVRYDGVPFAMTAEGSGITGIAQLTSAGNKLFFVVDHPTTGAELWVSESSPATTHLVKDIFPGSTGALPQGLTAAAGIVYFAATDGVNGRELWRSDGTASGTYRVKDILKGSGGSNPSDLENVNGVVYFSANDGTNGYELWKSNGTDAGTTLVADVRTGLKLSSTPKQLTNVNGTLYFTAYHPAYGRELWKSNGTSAGTLLVKDIYPGTSESIPDNLTAMGTVLYFGANNGTNGRELWKSNGTTSGTVLVKDINAGSASYGGGGFPHLSHFTVFNSRMYFMTYTDRPRIFRTDGTAAGTIPVSPLNRNFINIDPNLTVFSGMLYYVSNGYEGSANGFMEMWKTDGTIGNHLLVRNYLGRSGNKNMELTATSYNILFTTWEDYAGTDETLWTTDGGTNTGPVEFRAANTNSSFPAHLTTMNGSIYFDATNGSQYGLFRTDATSSGTVLVREFSTGKLRDFFVKEGLLYFIHNTNNPANDQVLWRSDGTTAGTTMIARLSGINYLTFHYEPVGNGTIFLYQGPTLWKTNGTPASTVELRTFPYHIAWMANAGAELLFAANDAVRGFELWKSDGTVSGTALLRDIWPGSPGALSSWEPRDAAVTVNGIAYFLGNAGGDANAELWRSDGTAAGTRMVKNDEANAPFDPYNSLAVVNDTVYLFSHRFTEEPPLNYDWDLWKSDGTTAGTRKVATLQFDVEDPSEIMIGGGDNLYFIPETDNYYPHSLYASDGTVGGTGLVKELGYSWNLGPVYHTFAGGHLFISSGYWETPFLLRTDGTGCGTFFIDFGQNNDATQHIYLAAFNNTVLFPAFREETGVELYAYDDNIDPCGPAVASAARSLTRVVNENNIEKAEIASYPNPFAAEFTLRVAGEQGEIFHLQVMTMNGAEVEKHNSLTCNETYSLGANWPRGVYLLSIRSGRTGTVQKVIKTD